MHKLIMNPPKKMVVDHLNHNKLDNRRENLRIITRSNNGKNKSKTKNASSIYYGVHYNNNNKRFIVAFKHNGKIINIGSFINELEAAQSYDLYIVKNNIEYKTLNFPHKKDEYLSKNSDKIERTKACQYIGVTERENNKFRARIGIGNKKNKTLLVSNDPIKCAKAYDKYIIDNSIPNKTLNFPEDYPNFNPEKEIKTFCEKIDNEIVGLLIDNCNEIITIDKNDYDLIKYYKCCIDDRGYISFHCENNTKRLHKFLTNTGEDELN